MNMVPIHFLKLFFVLIIALFDKTSWAEGIDRDKQFQCPDWMNSTEADLPLCPEGGLVPETYPMAAIVISDNGMQGQDSGFTADVVEKVLLSSGNQNPLIIIPGSEATVDTVKRRIDRLPMASDQKEKFKRSIIQAPTSGFTWQQDYMQPFFNPKTGRVVIREVENYGRHGNAFQQVAGAAVLCGVEAGPPLRTETNVGGNGGGNIETLPFGICLLGDDHFESPSQWRNYADQICQKGEENRVKVPTDWLTVGHSDEIMKVVRNNTRPAPCNFSIAIASPRKAVELLRRDPKGQFLDFKTVRNGNRDDLTKERALSFRAMRSICLASLVIRYEQKTPTSPSKENRGITRLWKFKALLPEIGHAGMVRGPSIIEDKDECLHLSNEDVYRVFTADKTMSEYNRLIQKRMDDLRNDVTAKLKAKAPQCEPDFLEVPNLFVGGQVFEGPNGEKQLPIGFGDSVLPNPTNSISVNNTIIASDPSNLAFRNYLESEYEKRGLKYEVVDTFDYAHVGNGNLHCSTNTFHMCKPRGKK